MTADNQYPLQCIRLMTGDPQNKPSDDELLCRFLNRRKKTVFAAQPRAR